MIYFANRVAIPNPSRSSSFICENCRSVVIPEASSFLIVPIPLAKMARKNVGDNSAGDIGWPTSGKWNDHRDRSCRIILGKRLRTVYSGCNKKNSGRNPMARHYHLPDAIFDVTICWFHRLAR